MTVDHVYSIAGVGGFFPKKFNGNGIPATRATVADPDGVAVDAAGNVLITDTGHDRVRVVAESSGTFYGQAMTTGDIYTIAGTGRRGFSGSGGVATRTHLNTPEGVTADAAGNVVLTDTRKNRVQVVAASTGAFYGQPMTAGHLYTIPGFGRDGGFSGDGGPATQATLNMPQGVAVDAAGNVVVTDTGNERVRVVAATSGTFYGTPMTAGDIYTIAGSAHTGFFGNGGPGTGAWLDGPSGVAVDGSDVLFADIHNNQVREVSG
jgi:hypothetical protein